MSLRRRELFLLASSIGIGLLALLITRANLDVSDPSTRLQFLLVCVTALAAHASMRRFAPLADPVILPTALLLNLLGLVMIHRLDVADAARAVRQGVQTPDPSFAAQAAWTMFGLSLCIAVVTLIADVKILQRYTYTALVVGLVLLMLPMLPIIGATINGARLWLRIGELSFQPSEIAKLMLAIFVAGYLVSARNSLATIHVQRWRLGWPRTRDLGPLALCWLLSILILVFERDLGTSLLFFGMFIAMVYLATGQRTWLALGFILFTSGSLASWAVFPHVQERIAIWLHPFAYAGSQGYQVVQGLYGLATGGLFGTGLGDGFPYLVPSAKSDFILASLGEELGFVGLTAILLLYAILIQRGMRMSILAKEGFGQLLAAALAVALALQVFVIAGGVTGLIPLTGLTTPFMSAGGSSLIASWLTVGLLLRISDTVNRERLES